MAVTCKEICRCCDTCTGCLEFQKILDLKNAGLVIYRYTDRIDQVDKTLLETSINTMNDVFIIHNTEDTQITTDEWITEIDQGISCARCKELIERTKRYLQKILPIEKKDVISICDHCQQNKIEKRFLKKCHKCYEILKKYNSEKAKQSVAKEIVKQWFSNVQRLMENMSTDKRRKIKLKRRSHSELYLKSVLRNAYETLPHLKAESMLEERLWISESVREIPNATLKSENCLKASDPEYVKLKSVLIRGESLIDIVSDSTPLSINETSLGKPADKSNERQNSKKSKLVKEIIQRDLNFKSIMKHKMSPETLIKFYSEENLCYSAAGPLDDKNENFSYVFPKEISAITLPLRRVKSSAELIIETQRMLQKRAKAEKKKFPRINATPDIKEDKINREKEHLENIEIIEPKQSKIEKEKEEMLRLKEEQQEKEKKALLKSNVLQSDNIQKTEDKSNTENLKKVLKVRNNQNNYKEDDREKQDRKVKKDHNQSENKEVNKLEQNKMEKKEEEKLRLKQKIQPQKEIDASLKLKELQSTKHDKTKYKDIKHTKPDETQKTKDKSNAENLKDVQHKQKTTILKNNKQEGTDHNQLKMESEKKIKEAEQKLKTIEESQARKQKTENNSYLTNLKNMLDDPDQKKTNILKIKKQDTSQQKIKEIKQRLKSVKESQVGKEPGQEESKVKKPDKKQKSLKNSYSANLKKTLHDQDQQQSGILKINKEQVDDNNKFKMEADRKATETERKQNTLRESKDEKQTDEGKPNADKNQDKLNDIEINMKNIKVRKTSPDDLILKLVKLRQLTKTNEDRGLKILPPPLIANQHKVQRGIKMNGLICDDSEPELDIDSIFSEKSKPERTDIIVGNKILKCKHPLKEKRQTEDIIPILYKSLYKHEMVSAHRVENITNLKDLIPYQDHSSSHKSAEQEIPKGLIRYALSDRSFIDKGWTMLPTEKVVRKMNVYRMRPAHPEFDWFKRNKNKRLMLYDTGEKLAEFDDNGRGRWFYRNGRLALDYYDAEEMNAQQRFVIYGSGEPDERGRCHPVAILATFDYLGNGIVFDHTGKIRLKYNQTEGVLLDRSIGPVSQWKWHTLNDPPVLQQVMIDTQMAHKDPDILKLGGAADDNVRPDNEEMLAIEFDNFIKEKSKKLSQKFKPFQIRTKALKINENFSLRVLDQANIYLIFRDGSTNIKMNIGMILDHQEIVDTDTAEVGEVSNNLERFPARTDSLAGLQRSVAHAQRVERLRLERESRLRRPEPCSSADKLVSAASRPLKPKLQTVLSCSTVTKDEYNCKCRKPCTRNVYYDTRFV